MTDATSEGPPGEKSRLGEKAALPKNIAGGDRAIVAERKRDR